MQNTHTHYSSTYLDFIVESAELFIRVFGDVDNRADLKNSFLMETHALISHLHLHLHLHRQQSEIFQNLE